jgi:hypothetical protein
MVPLKGGEIKTLEETFLFTWKSWFDFVIIKKFCRFFKEIHVFSFLRLKNRFVCLPNKEILNACGSRNACLRDSFLLRCCFLYFYFRVSEFLCGARCSVVLGRVCGVFSWLSFFCFFSSEDSFDGFDVDAAGSQVEVLRVRRRIREVSELGWDKKFLFGDNKVF